MNICINLTLIIVLLAIYIIFHKNIINSLRIIPSRFSFFNIRKDYPIDIVYTWVKDDEEFNKEKNYWSELFNYNKVFQVGRYNENEELKYSIRSVYKNFPYFRNIYVIVKDGQKPDYLKFDDRLKLVNHSEIIPKEYLPTFNSMAIEAYIHHIEGLSEHYIYFNDDLFVLQKLGVDYFIDKEGIPIMCDNRDFCYKKFDRNSLYKEYSFSDGQAFNNYLLDYLVEPEKCRPHIAHIPKIYRRSYDYVIEETFKQYYFKDSLLNHTNIYDLTGSSKFRRNYNLFLNAFIKPYLYKKWFGCKSKEFSEEYVTLRKNRSIEYLLNSKKDFAVVNEGWNDITQKEINNYFEVMEKLYPEKSPHEIFI
jgi:hypothetical protein